MTQSEKEFFTLLFKKMPEDSYSLFCIEQAMLLAKSLRSKEKILEFDNLNDIDQKKAVPGFSDEHSGGTYAHTVKIAIAYLSELIEFKRDIKIDSILGSNSNS